MHLLMTEWKDFEDCDICGFAQIVENEEELMQVESYVQAAKALLRRGEEFELLEAKKTESPVPLVKGQETFSGSASVESDSGKLTEQF